MGTFERIKKDLLAKKEGLAVGAIAGFILAKFWLVNDPAILQSAVSTQGIFDSVISNPGTIEVAKQKLIIFVTGTFAVIGYFIDDMLTRRKRGG